MLHTLPRYRYRSWTSRRSHISLGIIVVFINNRGYEKLTLVKYKPITDRKYLLYQHSAAIFFPSLRKRLMRKLKNRIYDLQGLSKVAETSAAQQRMKHKMSVFCIRGSQHYFLRFY